MRRSILIASLALLAAACSSNPLAPQSSSTLKGQKAAKDDVCMSGYINSSGEFVCTDWEEGGTP